MINRRNLLSSMLATLGASHPLIAAPYSLRMQSSRKRLRRVIFFLQNQGFHPLTCIPEGLEESCSLSSFKFAEHMKPLEPYKKNMHVIMGLHGTHTSPTHSAGFGALGGYRGGMGFPPSAITIDTLLSRTLPQTVMPHLCVGMDGLDAMRAKPTIATLSAHGAEQPIYMHSEPNLLYQQIFGSIAKGNVRQQYKVRTDLLKEVESIAHNFHDVLPSSEAKLFEKYSGGLNQINGLRTRLKAIPEVLKKYAPEYNEKYSNPEFETDWHDALLDISIACLRSNLSNVVTIGSGRGEIFGAWSGLGITKQGHSLGHMKQYEEEIWVKIRQYNCDMLIKLMKALEDTPEVDGKGSMMDHSLIVYTSNNSIAQHSRGYEWPYVLIGNGAGKLKTGKFTKLKTPRPINDLYTTLLHVAGHEVDQFNMSAVLAQNTGSKAGPIEEIMA